MSKRELCDLHGLSIIPALSTRRRVTSTSNDTVLALEWLKPCEWCQRYRPFIYLLSYLKGLVVFLSCEGNVDLIISKYYTLSSCVSPNPVFHSCRLLLVEYVASWRTQKPPQPGMWEPCMCCFTKVSGVSDTCFLRIILFRICFCTWCIIVFDCVRSSAPPPPPQIPQVPCVWNY